MAIIALIPVMAVVFASCNAETYQKRLEEAGYIVYNYSTDDIQLDGAEWGLVVMNERTGDAVTIVKLPVFLRIRTQRRTPKALRE